jgi:hypothetical protein
MAAKIVYLKESGGIFLKSFKGFALDGKGYGG